MRFVSVCTLLLLSLLLRESTCVVWGPKESSSGVRGHGQKTPQIFELAAGEEIEDELQSVASQFTGNNEFESGLKRFKRQSTSNISNIGYTARLANDRHLLAVVHWTGHPSENIFILTRSPSGRPSTESWLWRSTDYGHNFINETYKLPNNSLVEWYYISPYSEYLIFTDISQNQLYVTEDEGESYTPPIPVPFTPDRILFQSVLAPNSADSPYSKYVLGYDSSAQTLWVSMNLGYDWVKIGDNVPAGRYYWRRLSSDIEGDLSTVYFEQRSASTNNSMLYVWRNGSTSSQLFSSDLGEFKSMSFVLEHEYMFVQKPESVNVAALLSPLWVSHMRNTTFTQAGFPFVTGKQHYSVIDASEGQVFIAVYHIGNTSNLYISEEKGVNYSLSLQDIVSPPESDWLDGNPTIDVHVVEGVVGTYFANRHTQGSQYGFTVVTFDKGGIWNQLTPPALDYRGKPVVCAPPDCSLHLHMDIDAQSRTYQSILSQDSAIGLIMAQGNLGSTLSPFSRSSRLYFSRDGGFTWAEVKTGLWEFQFAGLGSVVVAVQKRRLVTDVLWTCDEGATWQETGFVDSTFRYGIYVIGMRTEIGEKSRHVTVFGYNIFGGFTEWLVFDLNFTSVVPTQCNATGDYYGWVPTDERPGSRCLLGEVVAYERRNASECCYVDPAYEKGIERSSCPCAIEDFECDFGFERDNLNSPCNPYPGYIYPPAPPEHCSEGGNYTYTSGYRKIAGDKCIPGKETYFFPITRPCPVKPPRYLVVSYSGQVKAGRAVTFTLQQFEGALISTMYQWDFNDSTTNTVVGFANAQQQDHTFSMPGMYQVKVVASNDAGSAADSVNVMVYDVVKSVRIVPPTQVFNHEVPTTISLRFDATVNSVYNTPNLLGIRTWDWDFGDGANSSISSPNSLVSYTYSTLGDYTVSLTVRAPFIEGDATASLQLIVYEVTFSPQPQQDGVALPPDTENAWHVVKTDDGVNDNYTSPNLEYSFDSWGTYHISVIGRSENSGAQFVGQRYITAQSKITAAEPAHMPTVRTGTIVTFDFAVKNSVGLYSGPLNISMFMNSSLIVSRTSSDGQGTMLSVETTMRGPITYSFIAENSVSSFSGSTILNVVEFGDYGALTIQFSNLPPNYNDSTWQEHLKISVRNAIFKVVPTLQHSLLEIVAVRAVEQNATIFDSSGLLKRAAETTTIVVFLYVDVNILPAAFTDAEIQNTYSIAHLIVTEATNQSLVVIVDGQLLVIRTANARTGGIIIEPPIIIDKFDNQKYAIIGGALAGVLIIAVIITVLLVVIAYFYRRKYNRLHVRYSRLQQTPVRFTFTPGGEMVEDFDPDEDDDDDTDTGDFQMK